MTDLTTAQLATILSALAGSERKPATKAAAMRAIARQAAALDLTSEAGARQRTRAARRSARSRHLARAADRPGRAC